ncbi:Uncharacterised protein [Citrobacter koseri]|uniref:Uncharacterized protein n=1 Tax=Citrobacter koseri TaxID=545 RepID=A0A2X2WJ28_CITKO|nr:Uncharacterised protein [Citrobacter koseri]
MLFFVARHHIPQNTLTGQTHSGAIKFVEQQDVLRRAAVFTPQTAAFIMAETVFVDQEEADFHAQRSGPAFQQAAFTLQQLALFAIKPGLVADPDIQVRRTALPY